LATTSDLLLTHIIPVIGFGENEIFERIVDPFYDPLHKVFKGIFKSAAPLFKGRFGSALPKRHSLITVCKLIVDINLL
jgi:hypothetical protein